MAYNILKHRRGTTSEWLAVDLVPEDGELVIEECSNGSRKCKLGDGRTKFSLLPYIDDELQAILLKKIDVLEASFDSKLVAAKAEFSKQVNTTSNYLEDRLLTQANTLTNSFMTSDSELATKLTADITATKEAIKEDINTVEAKLNTSVNNAKNELRAGIATAVEKSASDITAFIDNVSSAHDQTTASLVAKINSDVSTERANRESQIASVLQQVATLDNSISQDVKPAINNLDSKVTGAIEELSSTHDNDTKQLRQELKNTDTRLTDKILDIDNAIKMSIQDVVDNIDAKLYGISDAVSKQQTETTELKADFNDTSTDFENRITVLEESIDSVIKPTVDLIDSKITETTKEIQDSHNKDISDLQKSITDTSVLLNDKISAQAATFENAINAVVTDMTSQTDSKIAETVDSITAELANADNKHAEELNELRNEFNISDAETIDLLQEALDSLKEELITADEGLSEIITQLETQSHQATEGIANILSNIENIYEKTEQLSNADILLLEKLHAANNNLTNITTGLSTELTHLEQRQVRNYAHINDELNNITEVQNIANSQVIDTMLEHITRFYAELADLVDDDIAILRRVFSIKNDLEYLLKNLNDTISAEITNISTTLTASIETTKNTLTDNIESLRLTTDSKFSENLKTINSISNDLLETNSLLARKFNEAEANTKTLANSLTASISSIDKQFTDMNARIADTNERLETQLTRVSQLISLSDGSTTGDAELIDIRTGYDGLVHNSAGDAVRAVGEDVKALKNSLSQYIDTEAIDGLRYDYSGEVGLKQPYMLYLTAGGEVIENSGVQIISGAGGGGGASTSELKLSYITTSPVVTTANDKTVLRFTFSGTDSSGDTIRQASAVWKVNGQIVEYGKVNAGENEFDVTKYLAVGTTNVLLLVTDDNGTPVTKTWSVQQIELAIDSSFDDKITYTAGEEIIFNYIPYGAIDKTAVFILDGKEIDRVGLTADISGREVRYVLPPQNHGAHLLEFYLEAVINGDTVPSNHKVKDIIWYDSSANVPVIGTQSQNLTVKQYATESIIYTVYDPQAETPNVSIEVDGAIVANSVIRPNINYNNTPTDVYSYTGAAIGTHTIKITCGSTVKVITVQVEDIGINIAPVTEGLAFDFNPAGRSNSDTTNRLWSYKNVAMSVSDNFDWTNGGYIPDDPDGPCFCIKAGSTATINYKLFADDAKSFGKEFKLIFKTKNVANPDAFFLSCLDNTTDRDHVGIKMGVHNAYIYGSSGNLELAYSEEDIIEFEFNISKHTEKVPMVMGYEDGVPSRPMVYDDTYSFKQNTPKELVFGSTDCDLYIYRFKVYNTSLTDADILNNFIADARTPEEMIARYTRNQIYDENKKLTPDTLAEKCPWLRVYKLSAPHFTNNKTDKVKNTTIQQLYKNGDPVLDNWTCYNAQHSGQGTSSNNYGAAGRNLDFIMNKSGAYFELGDGSITNKITLTRESVPVAYLNAKVNIASSNNLTNAILANRYNKFNPYRRPFVRTADLSEVYSEEEISAMTDVEREKALSELQTKVDTEISYIKDTMEFYNCVIFIQETDPDTSTHREFADNNWHFYAIGNIGDSKKTDDTRLTDSNDEYECCVEIMDVEFPLSDFPIDTMYNAMGYNTTDDGDIEYIWAKNENLDKLYELKGTFVPTQDEEVVKNKAYYSYNPATNVHKCIASPSKADLPNLYELNGTYELTTDTEIDFTKTYYIDILVHDDFSEDFTYGWRYISDDEDPDVVNYCKQKWIDFYRFVTTSTDEEFKRDFENYFVKDSALYYYLFTTRYCMVDNRAKNTFWHYGKTSDGSRKWDLCWDYDNDTSLGLNNYGKQVYRYGLEDTDKDKNGEEVFREMDSTFFCRVRDCFAGELKSMYNTLESANAWHAESFINECDRWQSEFPEELWRLDIERKYIRTYTSSFINGKGDAQFLTNMANGRMKFHRRQWERSQEKYMASKYQTATAAGDNAVFRCSVPSGTLAVDPDYRLVLTPFAYMYLNVKYGTNSPIPVKASPNVPTLIPFTGTGADIVDIYSASSIKDFGNLATCYPTTADTTKAARIRRLTLGTDIEGYSNPGFTTLTTGANPLLEELNIENVTGLSQSLDLSELINLSTLYAFGTGIPSITFAEGGKISYVELPAVNNIVLKNLIYLNTDSFKLSSFDNVTDITIEDCPLIDQATLFNQCPNIRKARLIGINFGTVTYDYFESKVFNLKGSTSTGVETENAVLVGTANFEYLSGSQFNELRERYPQLEITYDTLESTVTFFDTDKVTIIHQDTVYNAADCENPVYYDDIGNIPDGMIAKPVKESTAEFDYEFVGWSTATDIIIPADRTEDYYESVEGRYKEDSLKNIEGDRVLYPVFKAVRRSYMVNFINPTDTDKVLQSVMVPYGSDAIYTGVEPRKLDTSSPDLYSFVSWHPSPEKIIGATNCYAQFAVLDDKWYTMLITDISDSYSLNQTNKTMTITKFNNNLNASLALRIPESFSLDSGLYTVTGLGSRCFYSRSEIELVDIPETVVTIQDNCFYNCYKLFELTLPTFLKTIGKSAFQGCSKLTTIHIPAAVESIADAAFANCKNLESITVDPENQRYLVIDDCLVDTVNGKALQGLSTGIIPLDGSIRSLGEYCFANTNVISMSIPEGITTIPSNAFSRCYELADITLPSTLTKLDQTCFSWCEKLTRVSLPEGLTDINTYVFNQCALTEVVIPSTVKNVLERSFGGMSTLKTVTFKKQLNENNEIIIPYIHHKAFEGSGSNDDSMPLVFNLPWSEAQHNAKFTGTGILNGTSYEKNPLFGAHESSILNFNYDEEAN